MVKRQWATSGKLWVSFDRNSVLRYLSTEIDTMQQMASDINKMRRLYKLTSTVDRRR